MKRTKLFPLFIAFAVAVFSFMPCAQAQTFLYEGFESGSMPSGWTQEGSFNWTVASGDYSSSTGAYAGTYNVKGYYSGRNVTAKLITPVMNCSNVANVFLSFAYINRSWSGDIDYLRIYYRTSSTESWTQVDNITASHLSWTEAEYTLPTSNSTTFQVAFEMYGNYGYGIGLDEVTIEAPEVCASVKSITSTTTRTSVTANWSLKGDTVAANCLGYEVKLTSINDPDTTAIQSATINDPTVTSYAFNNLDRETTYYVHVRSNCGNDDGYSTWTSASATTQVLPADCSISTTKTLELGTSAIRYMPWGDYYKKYYTQQIYTATELTNLGITAGYIGKVAFQYALSSSYTKTVTIYMGATTNSTMTSSFLPVTQASQPVSTTFSTQGQWYEFELTTPFYWDGVSNVVVGMLAEGTNYPVNGTLTFYGTSTGSTMSAYSQVDDGTPSMTSAKSTSSNRANIKFTICGMALPCPAVTNLSADSITTTSTVINWTASTGDYVGSYDVLLSDSVVADLASKTPQYTGLTATSKKLDSLDEYTDYYVYVRVNCNGYGHDDGDAWSEGVHFQTLSPCNVPTNLSVELRSKRSAMLRWTSTAQTSNYRYYLTTESTDVPVDTTTATVAGIYGDSVLIENLTPGTTYYLYLSNMCGRTYGCSPWIPVTFTTPDACLAPETVYASDIQKYQITLSWVPNPYADSTDTYDVLIDSVQVADFASVTPTATGVTGTSYTFDTLFRNTIYYMYVRANCGAGGATNWLETTVLTDSIPPDCQDKQAGSGTSSTYDVGVKYYSNYGYGQTMFLASELDSTAGTITSISFDVAQASSYSANWKIYLGHTNESSLTTWVPYSSFTEVATKTGTFTTGWNTIELTTPFEYNGLNNLVVAIANQTGNYDGGYYLRFRYENKYSPYMSYTRGGYYSYYGDPTNTTSGGTSSYRMNMKFNICQEVSPCPVIDLVTIPAETVLDDQALITWTRGTGDFTSSYDIIVAPYKVDKPDSLLALEQKPAGVVIASNLVDTFYLATGLTPETQYYVYVRANCKLDPYDDGSSIWKLVQPAFTTEKACVKPFAFQVTGATSSTMSLQWLNRKQKSNWELGINDSIVNITVTGDTCRYTVTNLTPNTEYTFTLRSICAVGDTSDVVTLPGSYYQRTLNNETNIRVLAIPYLELIPNTIVQDTLNHTITATTRKGSDLTNVRFKYDRSDYVSKVISSRGDVQGNYGDLNLTTPNTLTVVAEDTLIRQDWTMTLNPEPCATPYNVAAANVSRRTADLTWNIGDSVATSFDVVVSTTELEDPSTGTVQTIEASNNNGACSYTIENLARETTYYAYVRTNCGTTFGQWRGTNFTTLGTNGCDTMQVGTGTIKDNYHFPFSTYYHNSYTQQVYSASEIQLDSGRMVSSIDFNYFWGTSTTRKIAIYMANAPKGTTLSSDWYGSGLTEVYSAKATTFTSTNGWQTIALDAPFEYTGGDIVVAMYMIYDACETQYNGTYRFYYNNVTSRYTTSDTQSATALPLDANHLPSSGGDTKSTCPNIKFTSCYTVDPCPEVADLTVTNIQSTTATITWTATGDYPGTSDVFISTTAVDTATITTPTATGITDTTYTATDLTPYTNYYVYVRTHCNGEGQDEGVSPWAITTFQTESACEYPRNVVATLTGKNSARISWTDAQGQTPTTAYEYAYSTEEEEPTSGTTSTTGSADLTGLTANTTYYIYVRKNCGANQSPWIEANAITMPAAMPAPIIEEVYDLSFNAFKVRWTRDYANFANEPQWQYAYAASGESPSNWTTTTDTIALISGLTESTTYDFYVRATDGTNYSADTTEEVTTTTQPGDCITVFDGTQTISNGPIYSRYFDYYTKSITIMPASALQGLDGRDITSMTFYLYSVQNTTCTETYQIYLMETTETSLTAPVDVAAMTKVFEGPMDITTTGPVTYTFPTPFHYNGGNLLIASQNITSGGYRSLTFYGAFAGWQGSGSASSLDEVSFDYTSSFVPKTTFCCAPSSCPQPNHLVVDNITTTSARATWYPGNDETSWNYYVATEEMTDSALNTMAAQHTTTLVNTISGLTRDTDYHLYVQGKCNATDSSRWAHAAFATLPTCSAPINAVAVNTAENQITFDAAAGTYGTVGTYDYWYWMDGTTDTVKVNGQTATYVADNLTADKTYHWQVRSNCSGSSEGSSRWTTGNDIHVCGVINVDATHPFTENFDGTPFISECWTNVHAGGSHYDIWQQDTYTKHGDTGASAKLPDMAAGNYTNLVTPRLNILEANQYEVSFWIHRNSTVTLRNEGVKVFVNTTNDTIGGTKLMHIRHSIYWGEITEATTGWYQYFATIPASGDLYVIFQGVSEYRGSIYIDDISVNKIPDYSLTVSASPATIGTVNVACQASDTLANGRFIAHTQPTLTATPNAGFKFTRWSNGKTDNPLTVKMESDTNIVAYFDTLSYRLDVVVSGDAGQYLMGDATGSGIYKRASMVTIEATDIDEHYHVLWSDGSTENPHTFQMPAQDMVIIAHFDIDTFVVATAQNVDAMGTVIGAGKYTYGQTATIIARPAESCRFEQWSDGVTDTVRTYSGMADSTFTAIFAADSFQVFTAQNVDTMGTVTGAGKYVYGQTATITAVPAANFRFDQWSDGNTDNPRTVVVKSDTTLTAVFTPTCGNGYNVTDVDGNVYSTEKIGEKCWLSENLRTLHYSDGDMVPNAAVYYANMYPDTAANLATYGRLYSWYSAARVAENDNTSAPAAVNGNVQGVCPDGWHLPSQTELQTLLAYTASELQSTTTWIGNPGNNSTGFNAVAAGYYNGTRFENLGGNTYFWSSTNISVSTRWTCCSLQYGCQEGLIESLSGDCKLSVRCVKNE